MSGTVQTLSLVQRLSSGRHPLEVSLAPERSVAALRECIEREYIRVRFTQTRGGTELGFALDRERSDLSGGDFDRVIGAVTLVGELTLDFTRVRCIARIELPTMAGDGYLEPLPT